MKEYFTPERTVEFLQNCERAGITTHQFADPERALPYLRQLRERGSKMHVHLPALGAREDPRGDRARPNPSPWSITAA